MANTVRDIREQYPFMASQSAFAEEPWLSTALQRLLDARVVVHIAAGELGTEDDDFRLKLISLSSAEAVFALEGLPHAKNRTINVPVYCGRDNLSVSVYGASESWIIAETAFCSESMSTHTLDAQVYLHPDCIVLEQDKPRLMLLSRAYGTMDSDEAPGMQWLLDVDEDIDLPDNLYGQAPSEVIAFVDGHNTEVTSTSGVITITGAAGAGLGAVAPSSYADASELSDAGTFTGLRTINGISGQVGIVGGGAVSVDNAVVNGQVKITVRANEET